MRHPERGIRQRHRARIRAAARRPEAKIVHDLWAYKTRVSVLARYADGYPRCVGCGEDDFDCLTLDHIDDNGAAARRSGEPQGSALYSTLKARGYPPGYQTLCYNCNCGRKRAGRL